MIERRLGAPAGLIHIRNGLGLVLVLALVAGAVWTLDGTRFGEDSVSDSVHLPGAPGGGATPRVGEPAPEFRLERLSGGPLALADLRGRPVIVNFWASWCPPCRREVPDLDEAARQHGDSGLAVVAINLDEERAAVQRYAAALELTLTIGLDQGGRVSALYNVVALPTSFFVERQGIVRDLNMGALTATALQAKVARVLELS
jgi:cytochrome c biogenesis protein CcmG, thiol:disulfide interchange protein DsbE